jgi:hypothetical protein
MYNLWLEKITIRLVMYKIKLERVVFSLHTE